MVTKVLVVDDDRSVRDQLTRTLSYARHSVIEAKDGYEAVELALHEHPDIILLDVWMPGMDGFEVLKRLKEVPSTAAIPVILLTVLPPEKGERAAMELGVVHYITKPWQPGTVEAAVKVALREVGVRLDGDAEDGDGGLAGFAPVISAGNTQMDQVLGGGLPMGSLTLLEGVPSGGKSVLCQHLAYESLVDGRGVAYLTSKFTPEGLVNQMSSFDLRVAGHFRAGRLGIYPVQGSTSGNGSSHCDDPQRRLLALAFDVEQLPAQYQLVIIDDITDLSSEAPDAVVVGFFSGCKQLSENGRTIILVARTYAFDQRLLNRLHAVCGAHLNIRGEKIGARMVNMLEVYKIRDADLTTNNVVSFEVVEGAGLRVVPGAKVKV